MLEGKHDRIRRYDLEGRGGGGASVNVGKSNVAYTTDRSIIET